MISGTKKYTYSDYEKLPEGPPYYQLINGELIMTPSPTPYHQIVSMKLGMQLAQFVTERKLGIVLNAPLDVYLAETEIYQPDILFIAQDRMNIIGEQKIEGPPDLVVEILSPSTAYYDLKHKKAQYEFSGVKEYWIVDPVEKSVEVYQNLNGQFALISRAVGDAVISSQLLTGFSVPINTLF